MVTPSDCRLAGLRPVDKCAVYWFGAWIPRTLYTCNGLFYVVVDGLLLRVDVVYSDGECTACKFNSIVARERISNDCLL